MESVVTIFFFIGYEIIMCTFTLYIFQSGKVPSCSQDAAGQRRSGNHHIGQTVALPRRGDKQTGQRLNYKTNNQLSSYEKIHTERQGLLNYSAKAIIIIFSASNKNADLQGRGRALRYNNIHMYDQILSRLPPKQVFVCEQSDTLNKFTSHFFRN